MTITHHFVRRSFDAASEALAKPGPADGDDETRRINVVALLVISLTFIFFAVVLIAVS